MLAIKDSMIYTDRTKFLEEGTKNLQELVVNKTILNQKNFRLSDNLMVLKLTPVNFNTDSFEIQME